MKYRIVIIALVIFALGAVLFFGAWASMDFGSVELSPVKCEKKSLVISDSFHSVSITVAADDVHIEPSPDSICRVEYTDCSRAVYKISVENGCLTIKQEHTKGRNGRGGMGFSVGAEDNMLIVFLPRGSYKELCANLASADFYAGAGFDFETAEINSASGDMDIGAVVTGSLSAHSASGDMRVGGLELDSIELDTASGDIELGDISCGIIEIQSTSGDIELRDVSCGSLEVQSASGAQQLYNVLCRAELRLESTSGDMRLERCDAASLELESTSGYISGILLSGKDFDVSSTGGSIRLPESCGSCKCRIKTVSGDIDFSVAP